MILEIAQIDVKQGMEEQFEAKVTESYRVGSVAWSMKYFPAGQFTAQAFEAAEIAAKAVLDEALSALPPEAAFVHGQRR